MLAFNDIPINTTAQKIEEMANREIELDINENSSDEDLPSALAVYRAILAYGSGGNGAGGGVTNYDLLSNRPKINGVTLTGDLSTENLHIEGGSSVVVDSESEITEETLLVVDPDATADKIPEWYNGTVVSSEGVTAINGSAAGDYYINTDTFNVYYATAPNTWKFIGNIKGQQGTTGIFFGAYDGSDGQPPEDAVLWIDPNEAASADFITSSGLASALLGIDNRIEYTDDTSVNAHSTNVYRIGKILIQVGLEQIAVSTEGTPVTKIVYFSTMLGKYAAAPRIITNASGNNPLTVSSGIGGTTTEQFTVYTNRSDAAGNVNVRWISIGICE